jgi:hypothetical protein
MTILTPGHWHRYDMGVGGIIVQYECPDCHRRTNVSKDVVSLGGVIMGGSIRCGCGFHGYIKLEGWQG